MIKLATVGTSGICEKFISSAFRCGKFSLEAVYSRKEETAVSFAEKFGCSRIFTSLEKMADDKNIDAVYIASPNAFHFSQSLLFLENGKHVLCEKPAVCCEDELKTLVAAAEKNGVVYMEAIIPRHTSFYRDVKSAFSQIGRVQLARLDFSQYSSRMARFLSGERVNIFDMSLYAGTLMDLGVYCVYAAVDFLGEPKNIVAGKNLLPGGADGSGYAVFEYEDFSAVLTYSKTGQGSLGSEIIGEKAALKIKNIHQYSGSALVLNGEEMPVSGYPSVTELMSGEAERFAAYIENFEENREDYYSALSLAEKVHRCMDRIKASAKLEYK